MDNIEKTFEKLVQKSDEEHKHLYEKVLESIKHCDDKLFGESFSIRLKSKSKEELKQMLAQGYCGDRYKEILKEYKVRK